MEAFNAEVGWNQEQGAVSIVSSNNLKAFPSGSFFSVLDTHRNTLTTYINEALINPHGVRIKGELINIPKGSNPNSYVKDAISKGINKRFQTSGFKTSGVNLNLYDYILIIVSGSDNTSLGYFTITNNNVLTEYPNNLFKNVSLTIVSDHMESVTSTDFIITRSKNGVKDINYQMKNAEFTLSDSLITLKNIRHDDTYQYHVSSLKEDIQIIQQTWQ